MILSIDQGTTNTKALLVTPAGEVLASRSRAVRVDYPRPGWAELSAAAIWEGVASLIAELTAAVPDVAVEAIALANQRETVVVWEADTGRPIAPAVLWQCQRSAQRCAELRARGVEAEVVARSGLSLNPMFPAAKIAILLDSVPGARARAEAGELRCGTIDSWLLWNLTGHAVHATDHGNASRTQLLNLGTLDWDPALARIFEVPLALLPRILSSDAEFGVVADRLTPLPARTPIRAMLGDSHAALYFHSGDVPGRVKATIGTGSSLMVATGRRVVSSHGLSSTIAWSRGDAVQHALEGNITVSGHAAAFARALLGLLDEDALTELAASTPDSGGVTFVPALAGLGAPHWSADARGAISGLSLSTRPAHVARATFEAIACQIADVFAALEADLDAPLPELSIDGGAARNPLLLQLLADVLDRRVVRLRVTEASALGAARLAADALGLAREPAETSPRDVAEPAWPAERRAELRRRWSRAVADLVRTAAARETEPAD